jgi:DNA polymerase III subunit chi
MNAVFWLLSDQHKVPQATDAESVSPIQHYACVLAADLFRQNKKIQMGVDSQDHAHVLDEWLWQFEANRFIPHNLPGEGPHYGTPLEINWEASNLRRNCFINTSEQLPDYISQIKGLSEWHDFVPADEAGKAAARARYKLLKQAGFNLSTNPIPESVV